MKQRLLLLTLALSLSIHAQQYTFGIFSDYNSNGNPDEITVVATPDFSNANPEYADMRVALALSSGVGLSANSLTELFGTNWTENLSFTGAAIQSAFGVGDGSKDILLFELPAPASILTQPATAGQGIPLFSIEVSTLAQDWEIEVLENTDPLITGLGGNGFDLTQTINVDLNDGNSTQNYYGGLTPGAGNFMYTTISDGIDQSFVEFSIDPNPASQILNLRGNTSGIRSIEVFSVLGQQVQTIRNNFETIAVKHLENGVYFLKIKSENQQQILRFIKE